jgi:hypothetical protein
MTIISVRLKSRGKWKQAEDGTESATDVWEVLSDTDAETLSAVAQADLGTADTKIPRKGKRHPERADALVVAREADQNEEVPRLWLVTVEYSTKQETREDKPPLEQKTKGGMTSSTKEVPAYFDALGRPLVNSAGDLYEGITRKRRMRTVNCTHNFTDVPNWFFELGDTINSSTVTILNKDYPPGTCLLTDIDFPDEPTKGVGGEIYWPVTYKIVIDPDGYFIILPNRGVHELVYQTRTSTTASFQDTTWALYDAEANLTLKRVQKRKIKTDDGEDIAHDIWLDTHGVPQRIVDFRDTQLGSGTMVLGSTTLTMTGGTLDEEKHVGALVKVYGAGPKGRPLSAKILTIAVGGASCTLSVAAGKSAEDRPVWVSGAIVNYFVLEQVADWTDVPLPNNHPPTPQQREIDET